VSGAPRPRRSDIPGLSWARFASDEFLYHALALQPRCLVTEGADAEALATCEHFLTRWQDTGGIANRAIEPCETTNILAIHSRHDRIRDGGLLLPKGSGWRGAIRLHANTSERAIHGSGSLGEQTPTHATLAGIPGRTKDAPTSHMALGEHPGTAASGLLLRSDSLSNDLLPPPSVLWEQGVASSNLAVPTSWEPPG
jgi:hypothetical protein